MGWATCLLGLLLLLAVPFAHARSTVVPYAGFYDCRHPDFTHYSDVLLRTNGTYVQGFVDSSGRRFKRVLGKGVFTRSGSRLTFRSGPLRSMYGLVKTQRKFGLWLYGERVYSEYCYYTNKN
jgi:hypothetical protein